MRNIRGMIWAGLLSGVLVSGCVPLVVGAAAGVGGYAWLNGVLVKEYTVSAERLQRAVVRGTKELKLVVEEQKADRLSGKTVAKFSDGKKVTIDVQAVTERTAKLSVRVDIFGDKTRAEMVMNAIEKYL